MCSLPSYLSSFRSLRSFYFAAFISLSLYVLFRQPSSQLRSSSVTPIPGDISWVTCRQNDSCCNTLYSYESELHQVIEIDYLKHYNYSLAVRQSSDVVSNEIASNRSWEPLSSRAMLDALKAAGPLQSPDSSLLLDVGANIGWFTMLAAHSGYNVISFEPFEENRLLLFHSLCLAPKQVQDRVQIYPVALGSRDTDGITCDLWRGDNRGNVMTTCRNGQEDTMKDRHGWKLINSIQPKSMDSLDNLEIPDGVNNIVVKIDVEGWEPMALGGSKQKLFKNHHHIPKTIIAEIIPGTIKRAAKSIGLHEKRADHLAEEFVENLMEQGYNYTLVPEDRNLIFRHRTS